MSTPLLSEVVRETDAHPASILRGAEHGSRLEFDTPVCKIRRMMRNLCFDWASEGYNRSSASGGFTTPDQELSCWTPPSLLRAPIQIDVIGSHCVSQAFLTRQRRPLATVVLSPHTKLGQETAVSYSCRAHTARKRRRRRRMMGNE